MARAQERQTGKTTLGSRRTQGIVAIETGSGVSGQGLANQPSVLEMDSVDGSGNVTTYYIWVNRNGKLRISSTFPVLELSDGAAVGDQTGT